MMLIKLLRHITNKYGKDLVGEELGNFHIDLPNKDGHKDVYAIERVFLGKKTYIDVLEHVNDEGDKIHDQHIIMKGIPTACIKYFAEQHKLTVLDLYKQLYDNKTIKFDLINDGNTLVCRNTKEYTVSNVSDFTRTCQHIRYETDELFINLILFV